MICAANWKMNMGVDGGRAFLKNFKKLLQKGEERHFLFFPPAFLSFLFAEEDLHWGGQNIFFQKNGAWTGENSPEVLRELSARFCLLGHSERRLMFGETDEAVEKKFHLLRNLNILPVLCVGEKESERDQRDQVLKKQLNFLKNLELSHAVRNSARLGYGPHTFLIHRQDSESDPFIVDYTPKGTANDKTRKFEAELYENSAPFIIAYEPVWAIGSGKTPSAGEINEIHQMIKNTLPWNNIPVLYGGSVTENNASAFGREPHVDGFLVGGASLKAESFYAIFQAGTNA